MALVEGQFGHLHTIDCFTLGEKTPRNSDKGLGGCQSHSGWLWRSERSLDFVENWTADSPFHRLVTITSKGQKLCNCRRAVNEFTYHLQ